MSLPKSKITKHLAKDPVLEPLIQSIPFPAIKISHTPLSHSLVESIVYQQLSIKAAATIYNRLLDRFEHKTLDLVKLKKMRTETLRGVGLSYQKADYIRNIAAFFLDQSNAGIDWNEMNDEELIRRLTVIKGVGTWTVQMILISPMGRLDVLPVLDLGVQQGFKGLYGLSETGKPLIQKMNEIAESWRPYRSVACCYLWRWKDQFRK